VKFCKITLLHGPEYLGCTFCRNVGYSLPIDTNNVPDNSHLNSNPVRKARLALW